MNNKGNMILLTIIAIATLLVAVVGATFAYFGATISDGETSKTIEVTSGTLSIEHQTNSVINSTTAEPNSVIANKSFSVNGIITGSSNLKYMVEIEVSENQYEAGELVYTLTSKNVSNNGTIISSTSNEVKIPSGKTIIDIGKGSFAGPTTTGSKHEYTISIKYNSDSTESSQKIFKGKIKVSQAN